ncbi:glycosyltransferase [Halomonas daqiaonensis]|uniref:Glycosyltransferase involved in cell wall bisynthesis n=1 Tax=Halomonas daqiaonensis TaxID=650850 RepID=A0A1H7HHP3_9GAMM|nr:glycosyltransferase [Halomonas daqiaonensis]SEK49819.1 Glycosyltransferase involved in cell wall bisynthesis [Halomonas daqiaonensis]
MSIARPWIAYVGPVAFPEGGAAARRIVGNAKALVAAGYDVIIVSGQPVGPWGEMFDVAPGIRCVSVNERDSEHLSKVLRHARYALMGARSRRWLDAYAVPPAAVIVYSGYTPYLLQLGAWARRVDVPLLFDAVEWYTAETVFGFLASPYLWNTELAMRVLIPRLDGVIAISRALETYYAGRGLPVGRVPPLFDPAEIIAAPQAPDPSGPLRLAYAGSPGNKDLLDLVLEAVMALHRRGANLVLDVVGLSEVELLKRAPLRAERAGLPACLRVHGRVAHGRSMEVVGKADFTVFLRRVNRVSTNGFPTKFVESLALGTPVITNLTSDLADHLRDGENGFICPALAPEALKHTLDRVLRLDAGQRQALREGARTQAELAFAFETYAETLGGLIYRARRAVVESVK